MAVTKSLSAYPKALTFNDTHHMLQIDLSGQYITEIGAVYGKKTGETALVEFTVSDDIEATFEEICNAGSAEGHYQFKNNILHLAFADEFIDYTGGVFWFKAKRSSEPIETLDDLIDIPDSLVPLFVNKVLANAYHLQGKEAPITIKRRIKELE